MTTEQAGGGLFNPENFGTGGFLDDVDCTIAEAGVVTQEALPFETDEDGCYLRVGYLIDDGNGEVRNEFYGMGPLDKFTPSTDGKKVIVASGAKLGKGRKAALFFASLVNAGFPATDIPVDNSVGFLVGLHVHVNAVEMTLKGGGGSFKPKKNADGSDKKPTVVCITKLLEKAGAKKAGTGTKAAAKPAAAGAAKAAPAAATAAPAAGEADAAVEAVIVTILGEAGTLAKRLLPTKLMAAITDVPLRTKAFQLAGNAAWIGAETRPWGFDAGSGELSMNERTAEFMAANPA